jgi:phosphopantothenoylcysteine synthetase/decarboxylase
LRFKFFDELYRIFRHELRAGKYDIVIHSAAVSDYRPIKACREKIKSGLAVLNIRLVPTPKIIECVKKVSPHIFLVGFKFRPEAAKNEIIKEGRSLMVSAPADLVVANTITKGKYRAYILDRRGAKGPFSGRMSLAAGLVSYLKAARIK